LGLGHHSIYQNPTDTAPFLKLGFADRILYQLVLWFTQMGLCVFYRPVFQDNRSIQYINWTIGFLAASEVTILVLVIIQCVPIEGSWSLQFTAIEAKCMQLSVSVYVSAVCNIVADIVLVAFAVPRVRKFYISWLW
jgi:hypothetical protein